MRDYDFIKGETMEEQMKSIDATLRKFSKRLHKAVIIVTPPSVMNNFEPDLPGDGVVFRALFPCDGVVDCIRLYCVSDSDYSSEVYIMNDSEQKVVAISASNIQVKAGDMIAIKLTGDVKNIWTSLLFVGKYKDGQKESIAIDNLEIIAASAKE